MTGFASGPISRCSSHHQCWNVSPPGSPPSRPPSALCVARARPRRFAHLAMIVRPDSACPPLSLGGWPRHDIASMRGKGQDVHRRRWLAMLSASRAFAFSMFRFRPEAPYLQPTALRCLGTAAVLDLIFRSSSRRWHNHDGPISEPIATGNLRASDRRLHRRETPTGRAAFIGVTVLPSIASDADRTRAGSIELAGPSLLDRLPSNFIIAAQPAYQVAARPGGRSAASMPSRGDWACR